MQKTILFYKFTPVENPDEARKWQTLIGNERGIRGRVLISKHGINGVLGGDIEALEDYIEMMEATASQKETFEDKLLPDVSGITYKWDNGGWESFPKLSVKYREEIVAFDAPEEIDVSGSGITNGGVHLTPEKLHELMEEKGDEIAQLLHTVRAEFAAKSYQQ